MTREQLRTAVNEIFQEALSLHAGKNKGYAYEDDGLSNFKKGAARSRQTPIQYLWTLNSKQLLAVEEAIFDGKEVTYEKVEDKLLDNIVYSAIALAMIRHTDSPVTTQQPVTNPSIPSTNSLTSEHNPNTFFTLQDWMNRKLNEAKNFIVGEEESGPDEDALVVVEGDTKGTTVLDRGRGTS